MPPKAGKNRRLHTVRRSLPIVSGRTRSGRPLRTEPAAVASAAAATKPKAAASTPAAAPPPPESPSRVTRSTSRMRGETPVVEDVGQYLHSPRRSATVKTALPAPSSAILAEPQAAAAADDDDEFAAPDPVTLTPDATRTRAMAQLDALRNAQPTADATPTRSGPMARLHPGDGGTSLAEAVVPSPAPKSTPPSGRGANDGQRVPGLGIDLRTPADLGRTAALCHGLLVAMRTHLAQHRDISGTLARRRGLVCDQRVLESASAICNFSLTPLVVGQLAAVFPSTVSVSWETVSAPLPVVFPRVHVRADESVAIPSAAALDLDLRERFPEGVAAVRLAADAVRVPLPFTTMSRDRPSSVDRARSNSAVGATTHSGSRQRSESRNALRLAEAADPHLAVPADLQGFLSDGRAAELQQSLAYRKYADENQLVAKAAKLSVLETVLAAYDRCRAQYVRGNNTIGAPRALSLLAHLNCDSRPVEADVARRRLDLLVRFRESGMSLSGGPQDAALVVMFDTSAASRTALAAAVKAAGDTLSL